MTGRGGNPVNNMGVNSSSRQDASFLSDEDGKYGNRARAQGCFTRAGSDDGEWGHSLTNGSCWLPFPCSDFFLLLCLCCKVATWGNANKNTVNAHTRPSRAVSRLGVITISVSSFLPLSLSLHSGAFLPGAFVVFFHLSFSLPHLRNQHQWEGSRNHNGSTLQALADVQECAGNSLRFGTC